jgi:sugar-specific transcriptional regulator TrmB
MIEDEHVQTLMCLGLSLLQAKIYFTLCQTGTATVKTLSSASNIARQDIYRIISILQKLGLAEKILAAPTLYKPLSIKNGYLLLLQKKTEDYIDLQSKTIALIKSLKESKNKTMLQNNDSHLAIISSKSGLLKRFNDGIDRAQTSIDICGSFYGIEYCFFHSFSHFKRALKRGIKIRVIVEKQDYNKSLENIIQNFKTNPLFEVRFLLPVTSPINTMIYDGKEVNFCLETTADRTGLPSLWTNNPKVVKVVKAYFEKQWNKL